MWIRMYVAIGLLLIVSGCGKDADLEAEKMDLRLRPYMTLPGVAPAGSRAVVVYLNSTDGRVIDPTSAAQKSTRESVRLLIRIGPVPIAYTAAYPNSKIVEEGSGFSRAFPEGRAYRAGILRFTSPGGYKVYSWQTGGAKDVGGGVASDVGNYLGQIEVKGDMSLEYLYYAKSYLDHQRIAGFVEHWYDFVSK